MKYSKVLKKICTIHRQFHHYVITKLSCQETRRSRDLNVKQPRNLISPLPGNESQKLSHPIFFNRNWPRVEQSRRSFIEVGSKEPKVSGNKTAHKAPHKSCVVVFHAVCRNWLVIEGQRGGKTRERQRDRQRKRKQNKKKRERERKNGRIAMVTAAVATANDWARFCRRVAFEKWLSAAGKTAKPGFWRSISECTWPTRPIIPSIDDTTRPDMIAIAQIVGACAIVIAISRLTEAQTRPMAKWPVAISIIRGDWMRSGSLLAQARRRRVVQTLVRAEQSGTWPQVSGRSRPCN